MLSLSATSVSQVGLCRAYTRAHPSCVRLFGLPLGKLEDKTPFVILEDVFGYLTVPGCREVFSFLETRSTELKLVSPFRRLAFRVSDR
jgi:hypothetical protein